MTSSLLNVSEKFIDCFKDELRRNNLENNAYEFGEDINMSEHMLLSMSVSMQ